MKRICLLLVLLAGVCLPLRAADPELAGNWTGAIETNRGSMDIGLNLTADEKGKLTGVLKTAHGDWEVTGVSEKDGAWTVSFKGGANEGRMTGRVTGTTFAGDWKSVMSDGTFELSRSRFPVPASSSLCPPFSPLRVLAASLFPAGRVEGGASRRTA